MLCSGSTQNGVSVSICLLAAAEQDVGNIEEFSVTLWLLLSAGRAARRAGGKWLPDCFLSSCSQSRAAMPLSQHHVLQGLRGWTEQDISATFTLPEEEETRASTLSAKEKIIRTNF